jgi:succinyl-CoA synthetase beta subunit
MCQVGDLALVWQDRISELEINPLFVLPEGSGVVVGDALAVLR